MGPTLCDPMDCSQAIASKSSYCLLGASLIALQAIGGFPDSSVGKESAYYAGDPVSIPG